MHSLLNAYAYPNRFFYLLFNSKIKAEKNNNKIVIGFLFKDDADDCFQWPFFLSCSLSILLFVCSFVYISNEIKPKPKIYLRRIIIKRSAISEV